VTAFEARTGVRAAGPIVPEIGLVTVTPPPGVSLGAFVRRLRADTHVRAVSLERRFTLRFLPNDPALSAAETSSGVPPGTPVEWWPAREDLPRAWDISRGDGATVAVIDTGVDASHVELGGKIAATASFDGISGDGPPTTDSVGHGTHVASLACAGSDNGVGLAGAGLNCKLIVEKSDLSDASVAQAIVDATNRGADAINMSFGTDGSTPAPPALVDAINYAFSRNVVMAAAAADSAVTEQGDPANVLQPNGSGADLAQGRGLTVTAANFSDQRAPFAGSGSEISIAAYGSFADNSGPPGIFGAFPHSLTSLERGALLPPPPQPPCGCRTTFQGDNGYAYLQGTSMATPMVAAVGALVRHLNPDLSAADIVTLIKQTARRPAGSGWTPDLGWGILDGGAALDAARHIDRRPPQTQLAALPHRTRQGKLTLRWSATDPAPPGVIAPGIDHYEIWRMLDRRAPALLATTTASSQLVHLHAGHRYGFFIRAVDRAGLHEPAPAAYQHVAALRRHAVSRRPGR
jgi:subtilisin family serine protease